MPESVEVDDRFFLVQQISELDKLQRMRAASMLDRCNRFYQRSNIEKMREVAGPLIELCLVEDDAADLKLDELTEEQIGQILAAIADDTL